MEYNKFNGKRILITGGLGFLGSNLAHKLVSLGADVTIIDALIPECGGNLFNIHEIKEKIVLVLDDIRNEGVMQKLVKDKEVIFNLAGQISHIDSMTNPYPDLEINCGAQLVLLETVRKYNPSAKVINASTRQIYGRAKYLPIDENHLLQPSDVNGINKMAGEWYHTVYHNFYGLKACSLRLTNTFGPRQLMKHNRQGVVPWLIRLALEGKKIQVWDGTQLRDINYVDDVLDAFLLCALSEKANGKVYNLGHHMPISLLDLAKLIIAVAGSGSYEIAEFPTERKKIDLGSVYCSYKKIQDEVGWEPKTELRKGMEQTIAFYRKNGTHYW